MAQRRTRDGILQKIEAPVEESFEMNKREFSEIRHHLGKTQNQMAQLLGTSPKAVQSFEQGWRNIPVHTERQVLLLLSMKNPQRKKNKPCWVIRNCPMEIRRNCPAWEFQAGNLCWFINGTICQGKPRGSWKKKMALCKKCEVFASFTRHWGLGSGHKAVRRKRQSVNLKKVV